MAETKVNNGYLTNVALPSLVYLAGKETTAWFRIKRNITRINKALESNGFNEALKSIQEKFIVDGEIPKDKQEEADKLYQELLLEESTIDFDTIDIEHLAKTEEGLELSKFSNILGSIVIDSEDKTVPSTDLTVEK